VELSTASLSDTVAQPGAGGFEEFYRARGDRVYRAVAVTLGDPELARDATAEAMARAYARWSTVSTVDNPGGWVYRVALNWATSRWRRRRREHPLPDDLDPAAAPVDLDAVAALTALRTLPRPAGPSSSAASCSTCQPPRPRPCSTSPRAR
jgi:RNA polymerase sigma-70 factor (ECF subfamily)